MRLVDSYIEEAGLHLPQDQREDILNELRELIEEQVADRALAQQREAGLDDEREVLQGLGDPVTMARSYLPPRYLIGPSSFPEYLRVLRVVLSVVIILQVFARLVLSKSFDLADLVGASIGSGLFVFAIVTGIFASLEVSGEKFTGRADWKPDMLRFGRRAAVQTGDMATNLIAEGVGLLWWNGWLESWSNVEALGGELSLSAVWEPLRWPINLVLGVSFALHLFLLVRGQWRLRSLLLELVLNGATLVLIVHLLASNALVTFEPAELEERWGIIDGSLRGLLAFIGLVVVWDLWKYGRLATRMRESSD